jgi:hypothetical protein
VCDLRACWDMNTAFFSSVSVCLCCFQKLKSCTGLTGGDGSIPFVLTASQYASGFNGTRHGYTKNNWKTENNHQNNECFLFSGFVLVLGFRDGVFVGIVLVDFCFDCMVCWNFLSGKEGARIPTLWTASRLLRINEHLHH